MNLYVVIRGNDKGFRSGTYYEAFEDGFQEAVIERKGNRLKVIGNKGMLIPHHVLRPYVVQLRHGSLDRSSLYD